jgi:hypothetical protein
MCFFHVFFTAALFFWKHELHIPFHVSFPKKPQPAVHSPVTLPGLSVAAVAGFAAPEDDDEDDDDEEEEDEEDAEFVFSFGYFFL